MQLQMLKIFCDLVELGSFSAAGTRNNITQSAVSQQIRMLEDRFQVSFFERGNKKFSVTPEGRIFEQVARQILELYDSVGARLRALSDIISGSLRISTVYSIGLHDLPAKLQLFKKEHPEVTVLVEYKRSQRVYEDVESGRADVGLVPFPRNTDGVIADVFDEDELVVICSPKHRFAKKKKIKLAELNGESFVTFDPDALTSKAIEKALREHKVHLSQHHEFDGIETVKRAVEVAGMISIVPRRTVESEVGDNDLNVVRIEDEDLKRPLGMLRRQGNVNSPALREFMRVMHSNK
jgi:DNA-binding transcriptional LysR family regulator